MATKSNIGKTLYYALDLPAANTAAAFDALTWVKAPGMVQGPQFGVTHSNIDVPDLETGFTAGVKGAGAGQDSQMTFRTDDDDAAIIAAQTALMTAAQSPQGQISFKLVRGTGANNAIVAGDVAQCAQGYLHSYTENEISDSTYEGYSVNFRQNAPTVKLTET